jgi:23S rRNA (uracil1939-C5)-methyltransferase
MRLKIEKAVYGGAGLTRIGDGEGLLAGKTAFVPLTLPGELVEAHVTEDKRSFINAEIAAVLEPSLLRTTPACPYFGTCGGCSYQHAVYAHQIEMKAGILRESLERARIPNIPPIHTLSGDPWHYRNRIRLHIRPSPFALCYRERRSHSLLGVNQCPIAAPLLEKAIVTVTELGETLAVAEFCGEIEFFAADEDALLISFLAERLGSDAKARLATICQALKWQLPQLAGAALVSVHRKQPAKLVHHWGESSLPCRAAGFDYRVSLGSFFQVNRFLVNSLIELVAANRAGRQAWDLYAGVGLFARALTNGFERVIAVESSPSSAADLRHNLQGTSHRAIEAETLEFLQKRNPSSTPPDLVAVDPPRAGLGAAMTSALARIGPAEIVYVSCDPSTLSRDLAALVQSGYDLRTISMVDLFPQTFHLESVSVLTRR